MFSFAQKYESYTELVTAAEDGNAYAQKEMGNFLMYKKEYTQALEWYRKAEVQGNAEAMMQIAKCYLNGYGVDRDVRIAIEYEKKSAELGNAEAQLWLGNAYQNGKGVGQDLDEAVKWYKKAAEQDVKWAQEILGDFYYHGVSVTQNYAMAAELYQKAADQGLVSAQKKICNCFFVGEGVQRNLNKAREYAKMIAESGDPEGNKYLSSIDNEINTIKGVKQKINNHINKYGRASVEAWMNNKVIVGMSIKFLLECPNVTLYKMRVYNNGADGQYKVEIVHSGTAYSGMAAAPSAGIFYNNYRIWVSNYKITRFKEWTNADERDWKLMK